MHQPHDAATSGTRQDTPEERALELFRNGSMCSESIVAAFSNLHGDQAETAIRLSTGFAGGMVHGKTCGALCGAVMVIGLKLGPGTARDQYAKELCVQAIQELFHRFARRRKTVECRELLLMHNVHYGNPEEMKTLSEKGVCASVVRDVAELLEEILAELGGRDRLHP